MVITYYGLSCFRIQSGDAALVFDIPSKKSEFKVPRSHADIALQSHDHKGHSGAGEIKEEKDTFLISGPGEYEVKGIYIHGIKTYHDSSTGKKNGINTAYVVSFDDIKLCFMGDYGEKDLRPELKEEINKVDILFVPIGGDSVIDPENAVNLINQLEPAIAIPMHYLPASGKSSKEKNPLSVFLSEMGQKDLKPVEKLSIKKKDISEDKGTQIVVLSPV